MRGSLLRTSCVCVVLMLTAALTSGCGSGNKKDENGVSIDKSQRVTHKPDAFESAEDPPLNANTRFAAGQLADSQNQPDKALIQYREALKLEPKHQGALFGTAAILTRQRNYPAAVVEWQKYIQATNNAPEAFNNLAFCYEAAGQIAKAEETYRAGIAIAPKQTTCRVNYGLMLARQNRLDDAATQLATTLKPAEVSYNLGSVMKEQGRIEEAKAYFRKALEQDPQFREARAKLASMQ